MLTYQLDPKSAQPLYEQLYRAIREDIEGERLSAGRKLPSKRLFAEHLGVSVITVENAYRQLVAEGHIEARPRVGFFVADLPNMSSNVRKTHLRSNAGTETDSPTAATDSSACGAAQKADTTTSLLADFTGTHRSGNLFPFPIWARNVRRTLSEASKGRLLQSSHDVSGVPELRCAIAEHLAGSRGLTISPDQIVIGAGAQDLYGILVQLLGRDRTFAIEDPGYPALHAHYELSDASVITIPVDDDGMDVPTLERTRASVAHCTPAHQFPTGVVMSAPRRRELLDWALGESAAGKRYIIEDDYDSEFRMHGRPIPPLFASDTHGSVVYLNTFTRSLGSVFRIAYLVLPPQLMHEFRVRFASRSCMVGALEQVELARFITAGDYERHVNRQRTAYRRLQDDLVARLRSSDAGPLLRFRGVDAGLHFLMDVDLAALPSDAREQERSLCSSDPAAELEMRALASGIRLANIDQYRFAEREGAYDRADRATYVMNVAGLDGKRTAEIAERLTCALVGEEK